MIDRLDVVVELNDIDLDAVFVGPLLDDAVIGSPAPRHPADIDRPGDLEFGLGRGERRRDRDRGKCRQGECGDDNSRYGFHKRVLRTV